MPLKQIHQHELQLSDTQKMDINPSFGNRITELIFNEERYKKLLANKLLNSRLTKHEKQDIYRYLTNMEPPLDKGKGRPSSVHRDISMAIDFLFLRNSGMANATLMDTIREYDERPTNVKINNNAIYSAVDRGVSIIRTMNIIQFANDFDNGYLCDLPASDDELNKKADVVRELDSLIENYLEQKKQRKKGFTTK
jgi:hypothetical protein